jgi:predicted alpha-1,2-mannosidase
MFWAAPALLLACHRTDNPAAPDGGMPGPAGADAAASTPTSTGTDGASPTPSGGDAAAGDASAPPPEPRPAGLAGSVDLFIGTATFDGKPDNTFNGGNVFPGVVLPFGMVQLSPDTTRAAGGYHYIDRIINGFSLTHFSGRGVACWQDIGLMPTVGAPSASPGSVGGAVTSAFDHAQEAAWPGYYRVHLTDKAINVELTATTRTGYARFTFPPSDAATILIDAGHSAQGARDDGTAVTIVGPSSITGSATSGNCGGRFSYRIYFAAELDHAAASLGTWSGDTLSPATKTAVGGKSGAYLTFDTRTEPVIEMRVGISFVSVENARANLEAESPGWGFAAVRDAAVAAWNDHLARVEVQGGTAAERTIFYTGLYHTMIHPNIWSDTNGQYLGADGQVHTAAAGHPFFENFAGWDNYRSLVPLSAIIDPVEAGDMMQALVTMSQQDPGGGLPRWQQANINSGGMVGDGLVVALSSAHALGVQGFDPAAALQAMERNASDPKTLSSGHAPREGLTPYLAGGYIPGDVSRTLEYNVADFAVGQLAGALGDAAKRQLYVTRAGSWRKLYDPTRGYLLPRDDAGAFPAMFVPTMTRGFVEGTAAQYLWMIPHDIAGLADVLGGPAMAIQRLDTFFGALNGGIFSANAFLGNEPGQNAPWAYDFLGAPARTQAVVRQAVRELFLDEPRGLPGNDDGGATSAWMIFATVGLYPGVPGTDGVLVGSPLFPSTVLHLAGGAALRVEASGSGTFVQALSIEGMPQTSPWIQWDRLRRGGTVSFTLGDQPSAWGTHPEDAPPRFGKP